jgi:hypothetical protein
MSPIETGQAPCRHFQALAASFVCVKCGAVNRTPTEGGVQDTARAFFEQAAFLGSRSSLALLVAYQMVCRAANP